MAPDGIDINWGLRGLQQDGHPSRSTSYNRDGEMMMHETSMDSPGTGLMDGMLGPGQTYTVLLSEIVGDMEFVGYGWIVGNFDSIAGNPHCHRQFRESARNPVARPCPIKEQGWGS